MRLRDLEARVVKLERDPANTRLGRMTQEEIDAEIIRLLNTLAANHPTYDSLIEEIAAMEEPDMPDCARRMRWFIYDYLPRRQQGLA